MFRAVAAAFVGVGVAGTTSALTTARCRAKTPAEIINDTEMEGSVATKESGVMEKEDAPVRCVIVGGGYAGARAAYQLDSIFQLTLIDSKNFFEATEELTPLLCAPWEQAGAEDRLTNIHSLHRFYLKRANIVTGSVVDADEKCVTLADGRTVPYDVLILAPGEHRPFPWGTQAKTAGVREAELKAFNKFIEKDCQKIAVVGGGPTGCVTAVELANNYPGKQIDLFHNSSTLMPSLPSAARRRALEIVAGTEGVNLRRNCTVTEVKPHVTNVLAGLPDQDAPVEEAPATSWWGRLFGASAPAAVDRNAYARNGDVTGKATFDLVVEESEDTEVTTPSVLKQLYFGPVDRMKRPPKGKLLDTFNEEGYDYVFNCSGSTPNTELFEASAFLSPHLDWQRRVNVSRYMQLLGNPHVFCIGRGNNFPWVRGVGNSDFQSRTLFRNLLSIVSNSRAKNLLGESGTAISGHRMTFPRLIVPLGVNDAVGSTAWTGSCDGATALKELHQDRAYFYKEFAQPMFFKVQDASTVRQAFDTWIEAAATDVADFVE